MTLPIVSEEKTGLSAQKQVTLLLTRTGIQITRRFAYPFIPEISRLLGTNTASIQGAIGVQSGVGLLSLFIGGLSDRYGRKRMMLLSAGLSSAAAALGLLFPTSFTLFYAVVVLWGFMLIIFHPAALAYIADHVAYEKRGSATGFNELSWAFALIISAPLLGYLLDFDSLAWVYGYIFIFNFIGALALWLFIPSDKVDPHEQSAPHLGFVPSMRLLLGSTGALLATLFAFGISCGNEVVLIVYGSWMEEAFDLRLTALGFLTVVIALAELAGNGLIMAIADRFGKKRLTLLACGVAGAGYLAMWGAGFSLPLFMLCLFVVFVAVEIAIVGPLPFMSEILPQAKAVMLGAIVAGASLGRFAGAVLGASLYEGLGFGASAVMGAAITFGMALLLWRFIHEGGELQSSKSG